MNQPFKRWASWIGVVGWMGVIFYLSHQPADASSALSSGIVQTIIQFIETTAKITLSETSWLHYIVRKGAHLFAYFSLAILFMNACKQIGWGRTRQVVITLVACACYAASDEIHQLYIVGRSGEVKDVLIDTLGASIGIFIFVTIEKVFAMIKHKKTAY